MAITDQRASVKECVEQSRKDLLDLGNRNQLINFRPAKTRSVEVVDELSDQVFRILCAERKKMWFIPLPDSSAGQEESVNDQDILEAYLASHKDELKQEESNKNGVAKRHIDNKLQTQYTGKTLSLRLLNIHRFARTSIEEQGINVLFLSLGMLNWQDPDGQDLKKSPVLLIPAEISRADAHSKFVIRYNGDDLGGNLSLQAKLREELGMAWPNLPEEANTSDGFDLSAYFKECEAAITGMQDKDWSLDRNVIHLGFFSFHKYVMYRDLDADAVNNNSALTRLFSSDGFGRQEAVVSDTASLDKILDPKELFQVVDADSSQTIVLAEARSDKDMVVQGPPGTGKSQIIVNLIAQAAAENKTVLFVAEKLAALEVVKRRLENSNLGSIALELHSNKANKKLFLEQLRKAWDEGKPVADPDFEKNYSELKEYTEELNRHSRLINEPIGQSGVSSFRIFGRLPILDRELDNDETPELIMDHWENWTAGQYHEAEERAHRLQAHLKEIDGFVRHPFRDSTLEAVMPDEKNEIVKRAADAEKDLQVLLEKLTELQNRIKAPDDLSLRELDALLKLFDKTSDWPDLSGLSSDVERWTKSDERIDVVLNHVAAIQKHISELDSLLNKSAWEDDNAQTLLNYLKEFRGKLWRWIYPDYRAAARKIKLLYRIEQPAQYKRRLQNLEAIVEVQQKRSQLNKENDYMKSLFGNRWNKDNSDARHLRQIYSAMKLMHGCGLRRELLEPILQSLTKRLKPSELSADARKLAPLCERYQKTLDPLLGLLKIDKQRYAPSREFRDYPLNIQLELLAAWKASPQKLHPLTRFNAEQRELEKKGLGELAKAALGWEKAADHLSLLLQRNWHKALWKKHVKENPQINRFSAAIASLWAEKFKQADTKMIEHNKVRVLEKHYGNLPSRHGAGEAAILNKELSKKSRHLPIRKLMHEAGQTIQKIKPVFMMSPFSVASYLPRDPKRIVFDLVIFDEASQIRPVDAFGALMRGKQAVVVGDDKQMPPTTFFEKMQEGGDDDYEESETKDIESILSLFKSKGAFDTMLRWHYRSRHSSLIEYSNHGFYGGKLVIFPATESPHKAAGLQFVHLDGENSAYIGGKNPKEAQYIAEQVRRHAIDHPDQTLGVAAFGLLQAREIEDRVEIMRRENKGLERFFGGHPEEPFFVKNLENVQGDERDVIFISIGYGYDDQRRISMNFGPLNKEGGERRLNVLITRARSKCVIFSNMTGDDVDTGKTKSAGVRHLKNYLNFAEKGTFDAPQATGRDPDSPFEIEVAGAIRTLGWEVDHQVGSSGYSIDLAVKDPDKPGRYILAVECDGASYHSSRWARDRDRLRQGVLEDKGWTFHRIWSQSWFYEKETELAKIKQAIEDAKSKADGSNGITQAAAKPKPKTIVKREPKTDGNPQTPPAYQVADVEKIKTPEYGFIEEAWLKKQLLHVIQVEMPVHKRVAIRRVKEAVSLPRMTKHIRNQFGWAFNELRARSEIRITGDFVVLDGPVKIPVRNRKGVQGVSSKIEEVSRQEIREACLRYIMPHAVRLGRESLYREILKLLGMGSLSAGRKKYLAGVVGALIKTGVLEESDGIVAVGKEARHD